VTFEADIHALHPRSRKSHQKKTPKKSSNGEGAQVVVFVWYEIDVPTFRTSVRHAADLGFILRLGQLYSQ
jgi:hypothetical protein